MKKLVTNLPAGVSGVYTIQSPSGKQYIGSSCDIRRRWYEHHWRMKNQCSSSPQLDRCYAKYGLQMIFAVVEVCDKTALREREQFYIDTLKPELNSSKDANCAAKWLESQNDQRIKLGRESAWQKRRRSVEASNGEKYASISAAAKAVGCSDSLMRRRLENHAAFPCGTRFKRAGDDWLPLITESERRSLAQTKSAAERRAEGRLGHSEAARRRKSERTKGVPWSEERRARFEQKRRERA